MIVFAAKHRQRLQKSRQFQSIFNRPLAPYLNPFMGFDLLQFDIDIATPDGISMSDWIKQTWGEEAESLIRELIS